VIGEEVVKDWYSEISLVSWDDIESGNQHTDGFTADELN